MDLLTTNWSEKMKTNYVANKILNNPKLYQTSYKMIYPNEFDTDGSIKWNYLNNANSFITNSEGTIYDLTKNANQIYNIFPTFPPSSDLKKKAELQIRSKLTKDRKLKMIDDEKNETHNISLNNLRNYETENNTPKLRNILGDYDSYFTNKAPRDLYSIQHNITSKRPDFISPLANTTINVNPLLKNFSSS